MSYTNSRNLYYLGMLALVIYALKEVSLINQYVIPLMDYKIAGFAVITIIAVAMGIAGFMAWKYRKIG